MTASVNGCSASELEITPGTGATRPWVTWSEWS